MVIPEAAIPYIEAQRADCRGDDVRAKYEAAILAEYQQLKSLEAVQNRFTVADIGCGVGGLAAAICVGTPVVLYLIDRTEMVESPKYGFRAECEFYSSLEIARLVVQSNCEHASVAVHHADGCIPSRNRGLDLIISTLAMGFHFPWTQYRAEIARTLRPGGTLILDVRRGTDQLETLLEDFAECRVVARTKKYQRLALKR